MTRETKVGLVVATSFLGLVGVVVAARMSTPEISGKKRLGDAQASESKKKDRESSSATDATANDKKDGKVVPATHETTGKPGGEPLIVDLSTISNPPAVPTSTVEPNPVVVGPPPTSEEHKKVMNDLKKEVQLAQVGPPPGGPPQLPSNDPPKNVAPPNGPDKKLEAKPDSPPSTIKPDGPGVVKPPEPNNPPTTLTDPAGNATKPPAGPGPSANNGPPATGPGTDVKPPANPGPPTAVTPPDSGKPPVTADGPPNHTGPPNNTFPDPIGSKPPISSPPISVALAAGQGNNNNSLPQVKQYDVTAYTIKPEDRSFADISQNVYGSDKYARALVLFNREDNPLAPEGVRQEPPQLRPGTAINFPPKEILENRYAKEITVPARSGPTNPVSVLGSPTPLTAPTPGNPNTVAAPPPGTNVWTEPGGGKSYRVGNNGEHIYEIARSVLGDGGRWSEIYRLNPTVNPQFPIPAGTVLKLP